MTIIADLFRSAIILTEPTMDEITVAVARAVACRTRLRILSHLSHVEELTPTRLARELGISLELLCTHLRRLAFTGLLTRRRSATWCYCRPESAYGSRTLSGGLALWLYATLSDPAGSLKKAGCQPKGAVAAGGEEKVLHRVIFEAATAFTHPRRLQLLRRLRSGPAEVVTLTSELRMSESALSRHAGKLLRRGYIEVERHGRLVRYRTARKPKTPIHARWLELVARAW